MKKIFTLFAAMLMVAFSYAQLPNGSTAPDFTLYEIDKTTGNMLTDHSYNIYNLLNANKAVFIDVSATWCGPCYSFHQSGSLESIWANYGPNSSVNDSYVLWVEGDNGNYASLSGTGVDAGGDATQGDWLTGVNYPVIPLNMSPNTSIKSAFLSGYAIGYYPTIYLVCPNRKVYEMDRDETSGFNYAQKWHNKKIDLCPGSVTNTNDAFLAAQENAQSIFYCECSFQPQMTLQNVGTANMTSATLRLTMGNSVQTYNWTGNLAQFQEEVVTLPTITTTINGEQSYTVEVIDVNGQTDEGSTGNVVVQTFMAQLSAESANASQNFSNSNLSPWYLNDLSDGYCFIHNGALIFNAYSASKGKKAELSAPLVNFSNANEPKISFDLCYKRYNNSSKDKLQIMVSTDCGNTWTTVFDKEGAELATGANTTSNYVAQASEYQTQTVDLANFSSYDKVIIKFVFTSNYGNNIWIDNVNIFNGPLAIETVEASDLAIFPNPVKDVLNINYDKAISQIDVYDVNGKLVKTFTTVGSTINVSDLSDGIYMLNIQTEEGLVIRRIVKE